MDADRFDTLAKRLITPTTRRATLGTAAAGGLLSALGLIRTVPEVRAAQRGSCVLTFVATVRQGPSLGQVLTPGGSKPGELRGELSFSLSQTGNLENAVLSLPDGTSLPAVGQATGHSLQVRIERGQRQAVVAVGVGEQDVATCQGAIDGVVTGPEVGDLGDWHAAVLRQGGGDTANADKTARGGRNSGNSSGASGGRSSSFGGASGGRNTSGSGSRDTGTGSGGGGAGSGAQATPPTEQGTRCLDGQTRCGDDCVDTTTDPTNCSACGIACAAGDVCSDSLCVPAGGGGGCVTGLTRCGTSCANILIDPKNCGACGTPCAAGEVCVGGVCTGCPAGQTSCAGSCVDLASDPLNCGTCGTACQGGDQCLDGFCITPVGPAPQACAQSGESCTSDPCCVGFCNQDESANACRRWRRVRRYRYGRLLQRPALQCRWLLRDLHPLRRHL